MSAVELQGWIFEFCTIKNDSVGYRKINDIAVHSVNFLRMNLNKEGIQLREELI